MAGSYSASLLRKNVNADDGFANPNFNIAYQYDLVGDDLVADVGVSHSPIWVADRRIPAITTLNARLIKKLSDTRWLSLNAAKYLTDSSSYPSSDFFGISLSNKFGQTYASAGFLSRRTNSLSIGDWLARYQPTSEITLSAATELADRLFMTVNLSASRYSSDLLDSASGTQSATAGETKSLQFSLSKFF